MPYKRREPVSEGEMDRKRWEGHYTICQTIRDVYHMIDNPDVKLKLRLAMAMAKAMNDKLQYYKHKEEGII